MKKITIISILLCFCIVLCSCGTNQKLNDDLSVVSRNEIPDAEISSSNTINTNTPEPGSDTPAPSSDTPNTSSDNPNPNTDEPKPSTDTPASTTSDMIQVIDSIYKAATGSTIATLYLGEHGSDILIQGEIPEKNSDRYFGASIKYESAAFSEPGMEGDPYSLCVLKANNSSDVEQIKKTIKDNANPNKWVCVTAEKVVVESNGKYVILIMANANEAEALKTAFMSLRLN